MDGHMETRVALLEERQVTDRKRMDQFEKQSEKDIEKLSTIIKETEQRIMAFVQSEFTDIEKSLDNVVNAAKEIKAEQSRLADENKDQKSQSKINEAQMASAVFFISALFALAEFVFRFVI